MRNSLFGAVTLTKYGDKNKYGHKGFRTGFDANSAFSLINDYRFGKNDIIFGVDNSSSVHVNNKKKDILILQDPTDELDDITITAQVEGSINFTDSKNNLFESCITIEDTNGVKVYQLKAKDSEIKPYLLCLGKISKDFTVDNIKRLKSWTKYLEQSQVMQTIDFQFT